jgi:predicted permease
VYKRRCINFVIFFLVPSLIFFYVCHSFTSLFSILLFILFFFLCIHTSSFLLFILLAFIFISALRTGTMTATGEKVTVGCLAKIEMNVQANAMRITFRTLHPSATSALMATAKIVLL